jgi:hypothetical protein
MLNSEELHFVIRHWMFDVYYFKPLKFKVFNGQSVINKLL